MSQTIALVDDDRNILTGISMALEREGFKVQTYIDGESALIGLTRMPPDLAVVDIKMPKMDGEELLKKLRKKTSLPVIFLTSSGFAIETSFLLIIFFILFKEALLSPATKQSKKLSFVLNNKLLTIAPTLQSNAVAASWAVLADLSKTITSKDWSKSFRDFSALLTGSLSNKLIIQLTIDW